MLVKLEESGMLLSKNLVMLLAAATLLISSLACGLFGSASQPTAEATPIPVSTEAVENLEEDLQAAATEITSGHPVTVRVTEEQLTSLVAFEMEKQDPPVLTEPQVLLRDGQIQLTGNVNQGGINAPLKIAIEASVDDQGELHYDIISGSLGPLPLPDAILNELTTQLDNVLGNNLSPETTNVVIEDLAINDGELLITGHRP
jgi:uncharacterized protein YpmS